MKKYVGYFYQMEDGERVDDFKEWTRANSKQEAREYFESEYWRQINAGTVILDDVCETN